MVTLCTAPVSEAARTSNSTPWSHVIPLWMSQVIIVAVSWHGEFSIIFAFMATTWNLVFGVHLLLSVLQPRRMNARSMPTTWPGESDPAIPTDMASSSASGFCKVAGAFKLSSLHLYRSERKHV